MTTFSIEEATKSDLVSAAADQTDAFKASVLVKEFQVDSVKALPTMVATAAAMAATADTDGEDTEYFEELGTNRLSFCVYCSLVKSRKKILCTKKRFKCKPFTSFLTNFKL